MGVKKSKGLKKGTLDFLLSSSGLDNDTLVSAFASNDSKQSEKENITTTVNDKNLTTKILEKTNNINPKIISSSKSNDIEVKYIDILKIKPGSYQPRINFSEESLNELANSIKQQGVIQPIVVRPINSTKEYELIAGERRWRASQLAGLNKIPAVIKSFDNKQALSVAIIENIQREDLNPLEEARGLKRLIDEFNLTQVEVAKIIGRARVSVTNLLRLLSLDKSVQYMLENDEIEMGHARAILSLSSIEQLKVAKEVYDKTLSVRQTEELVRNILNKKDKILFKNNSLIDPNVKNLEDKLGIALSANVAIKHRSNGSGSVLNLLVFIFIFLK